MYIDPNNRPTKGLRGMRAEEAGFTIIELMIATIVFAVIMLVLAAGVIAFTDSYYRGITSKNTQETARSAIAQLSQALQFSTNGVYDFQGPGDSSAATSFCVGDTRYSYILGWQVEKVLAPAKHQGYHALVSQSGCGSATIDVANTSALPATAKELLGQHMRLTQLSIAQSATDSRLYTITLGVAYGDDDLLVLPSPFVVTNANGSSILCRSGPGSQFCATAPLSTAVETRLGSN